MKAFNYKTIDELITAINNSREAFVVFVCIDIADSIVLRLDDTIGDRVVVCSTSGEFTPDGYREKAITGFTYNPDDVSVVELLVPPAKSLLKLKSAYDKVSGNRNAFCLLLCDGLSASEETIVNTFYFTDPSFKIIGGSAGDSLAFKETHIYIGTKQVHSVALFFNNRTRTQIIKENLYGSTGKRMLVTEADPIKRIVKTFNNVPASVEYAKVLGVPYGDLEKYFTPNPLGKKAYGEYFINTPFGVNPDRSMTFYAQIIPNTFTEVLEIKDHDTVIKSTLAQVEIQKPSFVLSINCILRNLLFHETNTWDKVNRQLLSLSRNQCGFISYGEQYYKNHLNQTMVLLLVE